MAHQARAYPGFCSMKQLRVFLLPSWMGCWSIAGLPPSIKFAGTHLYIWVEGGIVRGKCLAQEHNTMSPARARPRTACSGVEHTMRPPCLPQLLSASLKINDFCQPQKPPSLIFPQNFKEGIYCPTKKSTSMLSDTTFFAGLSIRAVTHNTC